MKEEKFKINCISCGSDKIQTTLEGDNGYSDWTVMETGFVSFKCHGCGKFGSTDTFAKPNELSNFNVRCLKCEDEMSESADCKDNKRYQVALDIKNKINSKSKELGTREYVEKRCPQCVLENNNGVCDRKGCCNYQSELLQI